VGINLGPADSLCRGRAVYFAGAGMLAALPPSMGSSVDLGHVIGKDSILGPGQPRRNARMCLNPAQTADFPRLARIVYRNFQILLASGKLLPLFDNTLV